MNGLRFEVRAAQPRDAEQLASVHVESIRTLGAKFYGHEIVNKWGGPRAGDQYRVAMERERIFVAVEDESTEGRLIGFSSYRLEDGQHRTAVYVVGRAARRGIGSALFRAAEAAARESGATELRVSASLAAVQFYRANGFAEIAPGQHHLATGITMECVFMRKAL